MRQAGTLSKLEEAQRFVDYLLTQGISAKVDAEGINWAIWVRDEDQLPQAHRELQEFTAEPNSPRYVQSSQAAVALRKRQSKEDEQRRKNLIEMRDRWDTRPVGRRPLTMLLIGACIAVALFTEAGEKQDSEVLHWMWFAPPPTNLLEQLTWSPTKYIDAGQIWRLVTPIFIHYGPMHLVFNMVMFYSLGSLIEIRRGTLRFAALVLVLAVAANYAQYYFPIRLHWGEGSTLFGGMSGVLYGLFGYAWMKSRFEPQLQIFIHPQTVVILLVWLVLCWSGALNTEHATIANWEHTAGLVVGVIIGYAPVAWRRLDG